MVKVRVKVRETIMINTTHNPNLPIQRVESGRRTEQ